MKFTQSLFVHICHLYIFVHNSNYSISWKFRRDLAVQRAFHGSLKRVLRPADDQVRSLCRFFGLSPGRTRSPGKWTPTPAVRASFMMGLHGQPALYIRDDRDPSYHRVYPRIWWRLGYSFFSFKIVFSFFTERIPQSVLTSRVFLWTRNLPQLFMRFVYEPDTLLSISFLHSVEVTSAFGRSDVLLDFGWFRNDCTNSCENMKIP